MCQGSSRCGPRQADGLSSVLPLVWVVISGSDFWISVMMMMMMMLLQQASCRHSRLLALEMSERRRSGPPPVAAAGRGSLTPGQRPSHVRGRQLHERTEHRHSSDPVSTGHACWSLWSEAIESQLVGRDGSRTAGPGWASGGR